MPVNPETPFEHLEEPQPKRQASPTTTPELGPSTSPEARDHAHHSELWTLPVKELKALDMRKEWKRGYVGYVMYRLRFIISL